MRLEGVDSSRRSLCEVRRQVVLEGRWFGFGGRAVVTDEFRDRNDRPIRIGDVVWHPDWAVGDEATVHDLKKVEHPRFGTMKLAVLNRPMFAAGTDLSVLNEIEKNTMLAWMCAGLVVVGVPE